MKSKLIANSRYFLLLEVDESFFSLILFYISPRSGETTRLQMKSIPAVDPWLSSSRDMADQKKGGVTAEETLLGQKIKR